MSKYVTIKVKNQFITQLDDLRELDRKNQDKTRAYNRLKQIRDEEEKLNIELDKFNIELMEFKKYIHEESFKVEDHLEVIYDYESSINEDKTKQKEYNNKIKSINANIEELKEVVRLTKAHIEDYRPYEKCISDVIAQNPQYNDVFHIIEHVEELANIRSLGSKLVISDSNEDKQKNNTLSEMFHDGENQKNHIIRLKTDFNDVRTYSKNLKDADLMFIKKHLNVESNSKNNVIFNQVNPVYLQTEIDKIVNKRKQLETYIPKQQIHNYIDEKQEVIRLIAHQYREIYLKNNDKLPQVLPSTEDQLTYFSKFLKKSMKRLEIYKDVILGKMRIKEHLLKEKNRINIM